MALPEAARLVDWLDGAGRRIGPGARPMWIEVAQTVENWAGSGGLRATRCRCRGGSMVHSESTRPFLIAARHWSGLDPGAFEILRDDRIAPDKRGAATGLPPLLLLSPECAGALAVSLARRVHGDPTFLKRPAGPGWCLEDRPDAPEAIYGGAFDDLGLPTRPRTLADGKAIRDLITGPGSFRRPAFRDPPQPAPAHLVLRPPELEMPARFAAVTGLSLHPLPADRWMLELAGVFFEGGEAALGFDGSIVSTTPSRLIESCTGAVGPARPSYRGVVTPGLLFDAPGET